MTRRTDDRQKKAATALRRYPLAAEAERTAILREVAERLVDLRGEFLNDDGDPDWRGRTWAYRQAVGEVFSEAGVRPDDVPTVQAAVRYHVSNVLRERLSSDDLEEIGLRPESARERSVEKREKTSAILASVKGRAVLDSPDSVLRALAAAHGLLDRIPDGPLRDLTDPDQRQASRSLLADLAEEVDRLQRDARRRSR